MPRGIYIHKKIPLSTRRKMSQIHKRIGTGKWNKGRTPWNKGKKGLQVPWNKGLVGVQANEKHPYWKGENVTYRPLHRWVENHYGKSNKCENCGVVKFGRKIQWANKSGLYKRERSDWIRVCIKCHWKFFRVKNKICQYLRRKWRRGI